ncbi:MAG: hypothetical protein E6501_22330 [Bradyrhizobium sp.]|nr:hypothetical protein [Bradyrhizobium sp.]
MTSDSPALAVRGLAKRFERPAVDGLDLVVRAGEFYALAGALIHDPRLIILDEPLTGLDAVSARHVKGLLAERVRRGGTVIMTTHILEVAERMADRIGVIAAGRVLAEGTLAELRQQNGRTDTSLEELFIALVDVEPAA